MRTVASAKLKFVLRWLLGGCRPDIDAQCATSLSPDRQPKSAPGYDAVRAARKHVVQSNLSPISQVAQPILVWHWHGPLTDEVPDLMVGSLANARRVGNTVTFNGREPDAVRVSWSGREPAAAGTLNDPARAHTNVALIETAAWLLSVRALEAGTEFAFVAGAALLSAVLAWGQRQPADGATRRSLGAVAVAATAMAI
jgi:hypothetical protein